MKIKNEALRMCLAIVALILVAMLSQPSENTATLAEKTKIAEKTSVNKKDRRAASTDRPVHFAFTRIRR